MFRNLFAPRQILKLRWDLFVRQNTDSPFRIRIEFHRGVEFNQAEALKPYWEFVNYIQSHDGRKARYVIGPVGMGLNEVMDTAEEQAFLFLNGEPMTPRATVSPILEPHPYVTGTVEAGLFSVTVTGCAFTGCNRLPNDPIHISELPSEAHV